MYVYLELSIYNNSDFCFKQMSQIRVGLKDNLDVSIYAKREFDWEEMKKIRLKLLENKTDII